MHPSNRSPKLTPTLVLHSRYSSSLSNAIPEARTLCALYTFPTAENRITSRLAIGVVGQSRINVEDSADTLPLAVRQLHYERCPGCTAPDDSQ